MASWKLILLLLPLLALFTTASNGKYAIQNNVNGQKCNHFRSKLLWQPTVYRENWKWNPFSWSEIIKATVNEKERSSPPWNTDLLLYFSKNVPAIQSTMTTKERKHIPLIVRYVIREYQLAGTDSAEPLEARCLKSVSQTTIAVHKHRVGSTENILQRLMVSLVGKCVMAG